MDRRLYRIDSIWELTLRDAGIDPASVARKAEMPDDLFSRRNVKINTSQYYALWRALEQVANRPDVALHLGANVPSDAFDAPIFAAMCSKNLEQALERLQLFKQLLAPMRMSVAIEQDRLSVSVDPLDEEIGAPDTLLAAEIVLIVSLARRGTRADIRPLSVTLPTKGSSDSFYESYFSSPVIYNDRASVSFSIEDIARPFITKNEAMWNFFEPELRKRLGDMSMNSNFTERVRSSLLELLPQGYSSATMVAENLHVSSRTMQRRLKDEETTFQRVVNTTREKLARHYLNKSEMGNTEISYLLGYRDTGSFIRAFHKMAGITPEAYRRTLVPE